VNSIKTELSNQEPLQKFLTDTFNTASQNFAALTGKHFVITRYFLNFLEGDQFIRQDDSLGDEPYFASILKLRDIIHMDVVLLISESEGLGLYDLLYGEENGKTETIDSEVVSAIGEINNILGSSFVNSLADHLQVEAHPTTPINTFDMLDAILEDILMQAEYLDTMVLCADVLLREKQMGQFHVRFLVISPQEQLSDVITNE